MIDWIAKVKGSLFRPSSAVVETAAAPPRLEEAARALDAIAKSCVNQRSLEKQELKRLKGEVERFGHRLRKAGDNGARDAARAQLEDLKQELGQCEQRMSHLVVCRDGAAEASRDFEMLARVYGGVFNEEPAIAAPLEAHFSEVAAALVADYQLKVSRLINKEPATAKLQDVLQLFEQVDAGLIDEFLDDYRSARFALIAQLDSINPGVAARVTTGAIVCRKSLESADEHYGALAQDWQRRAKSVSAKGANAVLEAQARAEQYQRCQQMCRKVLGVHSQVADAMKAAYESNLGGAE
jgi:hypothetical protein